MTRKPIPLKELKLCPPYYGIHIENAVSGCNGDIEDQRILEERMSEGIKSDEYREGYRKAVVDCKLSIIKWLSTKQGDVE